MKKKKNLKVSGNPKLVGDDDDEVVVQVKRTPVKTNDSKPAAKKRPAAKKKAAKKKTVAKKKAAPKKRGTVARRPAKRR